MMTLESAPASLAHAQEFEFPPVESFSEKLMALESGCVLWLGRMNSRGNMAILKWHGKQIPVHRALYWYEYGFLPPFFLRRTCSPIACVAPLHRALSSCA